MAIPAAALGFGALGLLAAVGFLLMSGDSKAASNDGKKVPLGCDISSLPEPLHTQVVAAMSNPAISADALDALAAQVAALGSCDVAAAQIHAEATKRRSGKGPTPIVDHGCDVNDLPEPLRTQALGALSNPAITSDALDALALIVDSVPGCTKAAQTIRAEADRRRGGGGGAKPPPPPPPPKPVVGYVIKSGETPTTIATAHGMTPARFAALNPSLSFGPITQAVGPFNQLQEFPDNPPAPYSPTGRVDIGTHLPAYVRGTPDAAGNRFFTFPGGPTGHSFPMVLGPALMAGQIFTSSGHVQWVMPWNAGQTVQVEGTP